MWMLCFSLLVLNQLRSAENACTSGEKHCGGSLYLMYSTVHGNSRDPKAIFVCSADGQSYTLNASCAAGWLCDEGSPDTEPHCRLPCKVNNLHCGHQLAQISGWNTSMVSDKSSTIFKCALSPYTDNVQEIPIQTCYLGCQEGHRGPTCAKCDPGRYYCSSELVNDLSVAKNSVYLCDANGTDMIRIAECSSCHQGHCCDQNSLYCGSLLPSSSSNSHFSDGLYKCGNGIYTLHMRCANGCIPMRSTSYCACVPSRRYCDHELKYLGYRPVNSHPSYIHICKNENASTAVVDTCLSACIHGQCCEQGDFLCGSELSSNHGISYLPNGLYECGENNIELRMHCATGCIAQKPRSQCACAPSTAYCGHELQRLGYLNLQKNAIYMCTNERTSSSVTMVSVCLDKCIQGHCCDRDSSFCGSELLSSPGNSYLPDSLYECGNENFTLRTHCANGCIAKKPHSHCTCVPSAVYCGHKLLLLGFRDLYSEDIYICTKKTMLRNSSREHCFPGTCRTSGYVHCSHSCTVGSVYCGYENAVRQHQELANRTDNALYLCTAEYYFLQQESCRHACIARETSSECTVPH